MSEEIRVCHDMVPDRRLRLKCARLAEREWPENRPVGVDPVPAQGVPTPSIAFVTSKKWQPGRTIRIGFMDGPPYSHDLIRRVAPQWTEHVNLNFEFVGDVARAEVRIAFQPTGAWSYIGTDALGIPKSKPTMNFGFISEGTVLHEFGHMIGCIHEHQHPAAGIPWDEEKVYAYYGGPPNRWDRRTVQINLFQKYARDITQFSAYDPKSIMHYAVSAALLKDPSKAVGWNDTLSRSDIEYVKAIYPRLPGVAEAAVAAAIAEVAIPVAGVYRVVDYQGKKAIVFD